MQAARQVVEYEECKESFTIPKSDYTSFKHFCESKDDKKCQKLILSEVETTPEGKKKVILTATSYVGVYFIPGNPALIVQPKIGPIAFVQMFRFVDEENLIFQNILAQGLKDSTDFVQIFLTYFLKTTYALLQDFQRRGYSPVARDLPYLKGQLNLCKTLQNRAQGSTMVNCRYHRFDVDTLIHQAIKFTLLHIRDIVPENCVPDYVAILRILEKVNAADFILEDFERITLNRLDLHYKDILDLCHLILRNQMVSLEKGEIKFPAFCFNSWDIFEKFIRKILQIYGPKSYSIRKEPFYTIHKIKKTPDVIFTNNSTGKHHLVVDIKYKEEFTDPDYNEMVTYLSQLPAPKGIFVYPKDIKQPSIENIFYKFFDFKAWITKKDQYLAEFAQDICKLLS